MVLPNPHQQLVAGKRFNNSLGNVFQQLNITTGNNYGEFVATQARNMVHIASCSLQQCSAGLQNLITSLVAQGVIDGLKPVEIQKHEPKRFTWQQP